jgi:hypothetical protein
MKQDLLIKNQWLDSKSFFKSDLFTLSNWCNNQFQNYESRIFMTILTNQIVIEKTIDE